jgi:hypothetical protein
MVELRGHEIGLLKVGISIIILIIILIIVQIMRPLDLTLTILLGSLIGMAFLIIRALIVRLMHLQIIILTVTLKSLIPPGYFQLLKNRQGIELNRDINGAEMDPEETILEGFKAVDPINWHQQEQLPQEEQFNPSLS